MIGVCVAFAGGFVLEFIAVLWARAVIARERRTAAIASGAQAAAMLGGLGEAAHGGFSALAFILGYALGSYAGVAVERTRG